MVYTASIQGVRKGVGDRMEVTYQVDSVSTTGDYFATTAQLITAVKGYVTLGGCSPINVVMNATSVAGTNGDSNGSVAVSCLSGTQTVLITVEQLGA